MNAVLYASQVDRLEAASMKLMHAAAMADVLHDVDFRDMPGHTLQAYVHGLLAEISAAQELVDEAASTAMRAGASVGTGDLAMQVSQ